jgi:hypothetical protein
MSDRAAFWLVGLLLAAVVILASQLMGQGEPCRMTGAGTGGGRQGECVPIESPGTR